MFDLAIASERLGAAFAGRLFLTASLTTPYLIYVQERVTSSLEAIVANLKDKSIRQSMSRADARASAAAHLATLQMISRYPTITCRCGNEVKLALHENRAVACATCGYEAKVSFWPSADRLVSHFQMCDPLKADQLKRVKAQDEEREFLTRHNDRMIDNENAGHFKDALIEQLPSFAYSGKTQAWVDAPTSPKG